jgi:hypothetical protein
MPAGRRPKRGPLPFGPQARWVDPDQTGSASRRLFEAILDDRGWRKAQSMRKAPDVPTPRNVPRDIVAIGASAGGVEAIIHLLKHLPADLPAALMIVLSPQRGAANVPARDSPPRASDQGGRPARGRRHRALSVLCRHSTAAPDRWTACNAASVARPCVSRPEYRRAFQSLDHARRHRRSLSGQ